MLILGKGISCSVVFGEGSVLRSIAIFLVWLIFMFCSGIEPVAAQNYGSYNVYQQPYHTQVEGNIQKQRSAVFGIPGGAGITVGPYNPYSNLRGKMVWVGYAQRTPSFMSNTAVNTPAYSVPVHSYPIYSEPVKKRKTKKSAKNRKKRKTSTVVAKKKSPPKSGKDLDAYCQEAIELCKDYLK